MWEHTQSNVLINENILSDKHGAASLILIRFDSEEVQRQIHAIFPG